MFGPTILRNEAREQQKHTLRVCYSYLPTSPKLFLLEVPNRNFTLKGCYSKILQQGVGENVGIPRDSLQCTLLATCLSCDT